MTRYSLFVLKVSLNTNETNKQYFTSLYFWRSASPSPKFSKEEALGIMEG